MQKILVIVDMQNDFIDGPLGSKEAAAIVPNVVKKIEEFEGRVIFTRDTHYENYLETQEGKNLPIVHCIKGTEGWMLHPQIERLRKDEPIDKSAFGSIELGQILRSLDEENKVNRVVLIGVCTDICVISNAMIIKSFLPDAEIAVDASCCAGSNKENNTIALRAMELCQIKIEHKS